MRYILKILVDWVAALELGLAFAVFVAGLSVISLVAVIRYLNHFEAAGKALATALKDLFSGNKLKQRILKDKTTLQHMNRCVYLADVSLSRWPTRSIRQAKDQLRFRDFPKTKRARVQKGLAKMR